MLAVRARADPRLLELGLPLHAPDRTPRSPGRGAAVSELARRAVRLLLFDVRVRLARAVRPVARRLLAAALDSQRRLPALPGVSTRQKALRLRAKPARSARGDRRVGGGARGARAGDGLLQHPDAREHRLRRALVPPADR